jgi:recombination protein RecA
MGVETGLLEKSGTWFIYKTERIGQGRENAKNYLKANKAMAEEIEKELRSRFLMPGMKPTPGSEKVAAEKAAEKAADKAYAEKKEKVAKK